MIYIRIILTFLSFIVLYACGSETENGFRNAKTYEMRHPITLVKKKNKYKVQVKAKQEALEEKQIAEIKSFIYSYNLNGINKIILSVPENTVQRAYIRRLMQEISDILRDAGISKQKIFVTTYAAPKYDSNHIAIEFKTIEAKGPDCNNLWSKNLVDAFHNQTWEGLGCATRNNFAHMIVNPKDLYEMRDMTPGVAARRSVTYDTYFQTGGETVNASSTAGGG